MSNPLFKLYNFQRDLLFIIAQENIQTNEKPSGPQIKKKIEKLYGKDIHHRRLYPALHNLENLNLIGAETADKTSRYSLTNKGKKAVKKYYNNLSFIDEL